MTNSELKNKLSQDKKTTFTKTVTIDELYQLYKDDNLDISLFEKTEDGSLKNIDNRLVSNYTFVQSTKKHRYSLIKCFVKSDIGQNDMLLFVLSPAERFELTLKGEVLCSLANSWKNSNLYLKLKIVEWEEIIKANFKDN